jgi:hypothetical protein
MVKYAIRWGTEENMRKLSILGKGFEGNKKEFYFTKGKHENACQTESGNYLGYFDIDFLPKAGYTIIDAEDYINLKTNIYKPLLVW